MNIIVKYIKAGIRLFILCLLLNGIPVKGQVLYNESFESFYAPGSTITMPLGWRQYRISPGPYPDDYFQRLNSGINPLCPPHTGNKMLRFRSRSIPAGDSALLVPKLLDLRAMPAGGAPFNFWMYRDNAGFTNNNDRIQVYINTQPNLSGSPLLLPEIGTAATTIHRSCALAPTPVTCNGWNQYAYMIPNIPPFNGPSVYILVVAISDNGNDIHIDDFQINYYPAPQTYIASSAEVFVQNTQLVNVATNYQVIIGCKMVMDGEANPMVLTNMEFNTNGSTNPPTDISMARLFFSGGTDYFSMDNVISLGTYVNPWSTNYMFLTAPNANYTGPGSFNGLVHGDNYFWITYDVSAAAVMGDFVDAEWIGFNMPAANIPNIPTLPGARKIENYNYGYYTIGTSWNDYNNNDFINHVTLVGNNNPVGGINNTFNSITQACGINAASGCSNGPFPKDCPFQNHPFDYEMFPEVAGKTTELTANNNTTYPISIQCGTYSIGNSVAAWIDYNQDGIFNNWFYNIAISCTGAAGNDTLYLTGLGAHPGWRAGMNVTGNGIALGATVVTTGIDPVNGAFVVLSIANAGVVSNIVTFTDPDGEKVLQSQLLGALGTYTTSFRVPSLASPGKTRMRIRENWTKYNISPTAWYTYGESEDYVINILAACQTTTNVIASAPVTIFCINHPPTPLVGIPAGGNWSGPGTNGVTFNPALAGAGVHNVIYSYTDSAGCIGADTIVMTVNLCTDIPEHFDDGIIVYPNPASNLFVVYFDPKGTPIPEMIEVFDPVGRLI